VPKARPAEFGVGAAAAFGAHHNPERLELHRDWAVIGLAANEFRYTFERRRTSPSVPRGGPLHPVSQTFIPRIVRFIDSAPKWPPKNEISRVSVPKRGSRRPNYR
jgi:hypothetical protein